MKTIGLLGGMSWESSLEYYKNINEGIKEKLGGLHSAKIILNSVDFDPIEKLQHQGDWEKTAEILSQEARNIQNAGAQCLLICTNTMHKVAPAIQKHITIPLLHIADATAEELIQNNIKKVGLLGTAFTMEQEFYKGRLKDKYKLEVLTPNEQDRKIVHDIIYHELCLGDLNQTSKQHYLRIIDNLAKNGAQAVILGCTEISLLINQNDTQVKLFDTTAIHAQKAVQFALNT
ncbi:MAG: aspartate/glutamate racemase family protein [Campylobacterota bacterium]|nr:aspartate/glutamate racemase family protein [Campylobacterota bacterium]